MNTDQRAEALRKAAAMRAALVAVFNLPELLDGTELTSIEVRPLVEKQMALLGYKQENLNYVLASMGKTGLLNVRIDGRKHHYSHPDTKQSKNSNKPKTEKIKQCKSDEAIELVINGTVMIIDRNKATGRARIVIEY